MGLDIYLYKCDDLEKKERLENEYEKTSEENWNYDGRDYKSLTDEEKENARKKNKEVATALGLDEDGGYPEEKIEIPHPKYKDHYFKIGYFRSSYNGGGTNNVLERAGIPTLYEIFDHKRNQYNFIPDWEASLKRCENALRKAIEHAASPAGKYDIMHVGPNPFRNPEEYPQSEQDALNIFYEQLKKWGSEHYKDGHGYSNGEGEFYPKGIKVVAMLPGFYDSFTKTMFGKPMQETYLVYESEEKMKWYIEALEIVRDTILYVLEKPDKDKFYFHWSG